MTKKKQKSLSQSNRDVQIKTISDWISKGFPRNTIRTMIESRFDIKSTASQSKLIKESLEYISGLMDKESKRALNDARIECIINEAMSADNKNSKIALKAIDLSNKTNKLYEPDKVEINKDGIKIEIVFD